MFFDLFFLGLPMACGICLISLALRQADPKYWHPAFAFMAYVGYYIVGGREVLLYMVVGLLSSYGMIGSTKL
jgi:hypothetical protein